MANWLRQEDGSDNVLLGHQRKNNTDNKLHG